MHNTTLTLLKREAWEHKRLLFNNFFYVAGGLFFILVVSLQKIGQRIGDSSHIKMELSGRIADSNVADLSVISAGYLSFMSLVALLSSIFYLASCLYDDRKDRSILFWKSLPISEKHSTLAKFVIGAFLIPTVAIIIGSAAFLINAIVLSLWVDWSTPLTFGYAWQSLHILPVIIHKLVASLLASIWLMPFYAWCLFASAYAKRSPVFLALGPPLLLIMAEKLLFGASSLSMLIRSYFPSVKSLLYSQTSLSEMVSLHLDYFSQGPQIILGVIVTAGLIHAAVWLRENRYEI